MAIYSPFLTAVFLTTMPLYPLLMIVAKRWLRPTILRARGSPTAGITRIRSTRSKGIETVKAIGGEPMFRHADARRSFRSVAHKLFRADFTVMSYDGAAEAITFLGLGLFLWAGAHQVLAGQLTIGGLVAFNSLVTLATVPAAQLPGALGSRCSAPR